MKLECVFFTLIIFVFQIAFAQDPALTSFSTGGHTVYQLATGSIDNERVIFSASYDGYIMCHTSTGTEIFSTNIGEGFPFDLEAAGVDLATFSAHKIGGPLGVGVLVRRGHVPLAARAFGGAQEAEFRPGTENVPAIAAAAVAIELAVQETGGYAERTRALTADLWRGLCAVVLKRSLVGVCPVAVVGVKRHP